MSRKMIYLFLLLALIAIFLSTYYAKDAYKVLPVSTKLDEKPLPLNERWFEYEAPGGKFKVSFPLLPQTATQALTDPKTDEVRHYEMYVAQTDGGSVYMISLITLGKELNDNEKTEVLKQIMNDMVAANPGNKLTSSKASVYEGHSALDFTIENDQNGIVAKEFIKGNTIYLLSTITKKESDEKTHFDYFINSFKINP